MAGAIIPLWSAKLFSFTNLGSSSNVTRQVSGAIDLLPYRDAVFLARVHSAAITGSAVLDLLIYPVAPSIEDPSTEFVDKNVELRLSVAGASSGTLLRKVLPPAFGAAVQVFMFGNQPGSETNEARISAAFLGRR